MIKAPYNFVPLSEKVVMPFWAEHISQDIPFKDAKSGSLRLKITAESPIYVRNGMPRDADETDPTRNDFNNINGDYFIPGSSIKGMLRSVVEIMSFGRMKNKVNPDRYSVRDFQNTRGENALYPLSELSQKVECGWLYKVGDEYFIDKCGKPGRISHKNLDVLCGSEKISEYYKNSHNLKDDFGKSAKAKNEKFTFGRHHNFIEDYNSAGRLVYKIDSSGRRGAIVMTGQASVRNEPEEGIPNGKHLEFIFWDKDSSKTRVPDEIIQNFFFAYYDHDKTQQKDDWKWRKPQLDKGEKIPVFYRTHLINGKEEFQDIGLTMLYKITYNNSILDSINKHQREADSYDLAEAIFGYVEGERALKGRVHIGHAFVSNGAPQPLDLKIEVLAGPKASYYPNYIEQKLNENGTVKRYKTFMDSDAKIRGWKRYPVHSGEVKKNPPPVIKGRVNEKVVSKFIPLPKKTEFTLDIAYHNLREEELGALISAITFHNTDGLYHSIGAAKPLGYGKIKITIEDGLTKNEQINAMKTYEAFMDYALEHSTPLWFQTPQIRELLTMAKPGNEDSKLAYMDLVEFANAKGRKKTDPKLALPQYSLISKNQKACKSLISEQDLANSQHKYEEEKKSFENLKDILELKEDKLYQEEQNLKTALEALKEKLIEEIKDLRIKTLQREVEKRKQEEEEDRLNKRVDRMERAKQKGFVLSDNFKVDDRNAFNNLNKELMIYALNLYGLNENQLKKQKKNEAWFKGDDVLAIGAIVKEIYYHLPNKKEVAKWNKKPLENNFIFKKVREWLGAEQAKEIFDKLLK